MAKRIKEKVIIKGKTRWVTGYSIRDLLDNYVKLLEQEGIISVLREDIPLLGIYLKEYYKTFKTKQASNTIVNRTRIINNHILPRFENTRIDQITTIDIQEWFNELGEELAKETILKIKNIISPVFDAAVEDQLIDRNPIKSRRIDIFGKETVQHKAMPREKMDEIKNKLHSLKEREKFMTALLCYTGMRFEEVLGLRWEDILDEWIIIGRAVVHPTRNMPIIKEPKTESSYRIIPLKPELKDILTSLSEKGFLLYSTKDPSHETPLSYSEARRSFDKIRNTFGIYEYTAHDFRDTCATEWRENGIPLDMIARLLGHAKTETTEKRYVKYRSEFMDNIRELM